MAQFTFVPFETFITARPVRHHSSRVYLNKQEGLELGNITLAASVSDAFIRDVTTAVLAASVSNGVIRDVVGIIVPPTTGPFLSTAATSILFPATDVGSVEEMVLLMVNTGDAPLNIISFQITGDFSLLSLVKE